MYIFLYCMYAGWRIYILPLSDTLTLVNQRRINENRIREETAEFAKNALGKEVEQLKVMREDMKIAMDDNENKYKGKRVIFCMYACGKSYI